MATIALSVASFMVACIAAAVAVTMDCGARVTTIVAMTAATMAAASVVLWLSRRK